MCGIAGIYLKRQDLTTTRFPVERMADELLLGIVSRGRHATGLVAANRDGTTVHCQKDNVPAEFFVQYRDDLPRDTKMLLLHTRLATQGAAEKNENNHPVQYGGTYVTHNGVVYNDDWLFKTELAEFERVAEVDSIVFPTMIEEWGWDEIRKSLQLVTGSYAVACIQPEKHPDELIIARGESSPVHYYETSQAVVWASEQWQLKNAWEASYGTAPATMYYLDEGQMLVCKGDAVTVERYMDSPSRYQYTSAKTQQFGWAWEDSSRQTAKEEAKTEHRGSSNADCLECGERLGVKAIWGEYNTKTHRCKWRVWVCLECFKDGKETPDDLEWNHVTEPVESWYTPIEAEPKNIGSIKGNSLYVDEFLNLQPGQVIPDYLVEEAFSDADCECCGSWGSTYALDDDGMPICRECYFMATDTTETVLNKCERCKVWVDNVTLTMLGELCQYCIKEVDSEEESVRAAFDVCSGCDRVLNTKALNYKDEELPRCDACTPALERTVEREFDLDAGFGRFLEMYRNYGEDLFETYEAMQLVAEEYRMPAGLLTYICYRADTGGDRHLIWTRHAMLTAVELAVKAQHTRSEVEGATS